MPTPWDSPVRTGNRLDYEVELCAVLLSDHSTGSPAGLGYTLCGDYTDRWTLVREIDLDAETGRTGFASAKGGGTRLPVGALLVIPRNENFYRELELSLYLDDTLRQREVAGAMVWSPREILDRAMGDCDAPYETRQGVVHIADCDGVPAGTLILTGTPAGVLFHLATLWNPWAYLREGDVVTSFGSYLGFLRNRVESR
jgi:2-keto-4-pentenoate hydratase/2-oxohepta-3-ene-1,7-dioic acid hydratase in catechol pathway